MAKKPTQNESCLWERQVGESDAAWEAFLTYRDFEGKRTNQAVADKLQKSCTLIRRWKATWYWEERVRAYENELDREAFEEEKKERRKMAKRHLSIASRLQRAALEGLENLDTSQLSPKEIKEFLRFATELERDRRNEIINSYEQEVTSEEQGEDVVIYVPDNGMEVDGE